jgi:hypothetical protein
MVKNVRVYFRKYFFSSPEYRYRTPTSTPLLGRAVAVSLERDERRSRRVASAFSRRGRRERVSFARGHDGVPRVTTTRASRLAPRAPSMRPSFAAAFVAALAVSASAVPSDTSDLIPSLLAELPDGLGPELRAIMRDLRMDDDLTHVARFHTEDVAEVNHSLAFIQCVQSLLPAPTRRARSRPAIRSGAPHHTCALLPPARFTRTFPDRRRFRDSG